MDTKLLSDHRHEGQEWKSCTLCRSLNQSKSVLYRSLRRKVDWSESKRPSNMGSADHTSVDDAFSSVLQYMNTATRQCKRFYRTCGPSCMNSTDRDHFCRFHSSANRKTQTRNPLQRQEDVSLCVQPGTYAVTMGEWGAGQKQTHIVDVAHGQSVNLDFIM